MSSVSARYFVDTNILVYAHDVAAGAKHARAKALVTDLWEARAGVLSTQVLQEFCVNVRRRSARPLSREDLRQLMQLYSTWEIVTHTAASILEVVEIEARFQLSFWDALIVPAAQASGASRPQFRRPLGWSRGATAGREATREMPRFGPTAPAGSRYFSSADSSSRPGGGRGRGLGI
jgi:predicted nucleic acid-binding protein